MLLARDLLDLPPAREDFSSRMAVLASELEPSWRELIALAFGPERASGEGLQKFWARIPSDRPRTTLVVELGERVIAALTIRWAPPPENAPYLHLVAVHPEHRRRGLASDLVLCALDRLARQGATRAFIGTNREAALRIYRRLGFAPVAAER